jgi:hypothetical protein
LTRAIRFVGPWLVGSLRLVDFIADRLTPRPVASRIDLRLFVSCHVEHSPGESRGSHGSRILFSLVWTSRRPSPAGERRSGASARWDDAVEE